MFNRTRKGWATACAVGFGLLFVTFSFTGPLSRLLWPIDWPGPASLSSLDPATRFGGLDPRIADELYRRGLVHHFIHISVFGAVIGWLQVRTLQAPELRTWSWVLLTSLGFASIFVFEAFRPGIVVGGHPAPIEPLMIGVLGGGLAGIYQWVYLRRNGVVATKWLALWVVGLAAGAAAAAVVLTLLGPLGPFVRSVVPESRFFAVSQFVFYVVYGPTVGLAAGLLSGRALIKALPDLTERSAA